MSIEIMKQVREAFRLCVPMDGYHAEVDAVFKRLDQAIGNAEPQTSLWKEYWLDILKENNDLHERIAKAEKQEPVVRYFEQWQASPLEEVDEERFNKLPESVRFKLYEAPQPAQKPLMLEKFREMEALLDDSNAPQHKTITDDELKIIMETTMPVIDWKARYGVELNNGERNKWMLEWFIAFARAIEAAPGIKE